jgi:hypothetical protein
MNDHTIVPCDPLEISTRVKSTGERFDDSPADAG